MAIIIKPSSFNYTIDSTGEECEVNGSDIQFDSHCVNRNPQYKEDDTEELHYFSVNTLHGTFKWTVNLTIGMQGFEITESVLTEYPKGITVEENTTFSICEYEENVA